MGLAGARAREGGWLRGGCPARGPAHQTTRGYFFPWFLTASIEAAAAAGSR